MDSTDKTVHNIEPYLYVKKYNNIHYLIHVIIEDANYVEKISSNIYNALIFHDVIKESKEIILIYEIDSVKELNNVTCIKHIDNKVDFIYDKKELSLIFPDLMKKAFKDEMHCAVYDYQNGGYYFTKTNIFNTLFNLNVGVKDFPINNVDYFVCVKSFKK